jgi:hypothetical protein
MKIKMKVILLIATSVLFTSCVDEYWPVLDKYENLLVVDGYISNEPGPYTVILSMSSKLDERQNIPVTNASVVIMDDQGGSETLTEIDPGTYITSSTGIQGTIGRQYKIKIITSGGKNYESGFEEIKNPVEIDTVFPEVEYHALDNLTHNRVGYQFYLNTASAVSDTNYYLARLEATYEYRADFLITLVYDGTLRPFTNSDSLQTCWRTYKVQEIFSYTDKNQSEPAVTDVPLNYVDTETRELAIRYSLLVKQFTLSETAYKFWNSIKEQNSNQGGLYNTQPYQIRGNLVNTSDPEEPVLGYFMVAGVAKRRIFVTPDMLPVTFYYPVCVLGQQDYESMSSVFLSNPSDWPIYVTTDDFGTPALPAPECMDCRKSGGTIVKPDFWEE